MKFSSKLLKQAGKTVCVLMQSDRPIDAKNSGDPIGVVSSEEAAKLFYGQDSKRRNYFIFNLDELPEQTGIPSSPITQPLPSIEDLNATRRKVEENTQRMEQFLAEMKNKRKNDTLI